ncbi:hypothetical protein SAMN05421837_119109 [Amycolatopsis pretoriensis]|uniref:Membrane-associated oxidoreductase n=1 Tax=Amycolatopsis pretoriensis TaxID=218821 RepID=A0A1H5RIU0_9PSEU|nr:hypothetical protein [Amycolatopsis pretoriensis]SEF38275.1 hypothetical protein SAMN05421837_119109 [Amycolatopsis pretoriensis]
MTLPVLGKLTGAERELVDAARSGLAYVTDAPVRAAVLRELLLGLRGPVDPRGVRVGGARIAGTLNLDHVDALAGLALVDCVVVNPISARAATLPWLDLSGGRVAGFDGTGVRIGHDLDLTGVRATGSGDFGVICLRDARVDGLVVFARAEIRSTDGPALYLDDLECRALRGVGLRATGTGESGAIRLLGARVSGEVFLGEAALTNESGPVVHADSAVVGGDLNLAAAVVTGGGDAGALRLLGARVGGQLDLGEAELVNDSGPAVGADRLRAGGLYGTGVTVTGAFSLLNARIDGQVNLGGAALVNPRGRALSADSARIEGSVHAAGLRASGPVSLIGAHVTGDLHLAGTELAGDEDPALVGARLRVDGTLRLSGLTATGAIHLAGAHIGGELTLTGAEIAATGTVLDLEAAVVDGPVFVPPGIGRVDLDGFRFGSLGDVTWREWLTLIRSHAATYRPGPYQQLATAERAAGHDGNARQILIAQQRDLHRRAPKAIGGWPARRFHWLWGFLAGYGYRARQTAAALLLAVVAAGGLGLWAGHVGSGGHRAAERTADLTAATGTPCTTVELIGVGLDRGLPLSPGVRGRCDLNTGIAAGQWFTVAIWLVQAAIWALATLALVGYTGLVRKTG